MSMEIPIDEVVFNQPVAKPKIVQPVWRDCSIGLTIDCSNGYDYWTVEQTPRGFEPVQWLKVVNLKYPVHEVHSAHHSMIEAKRFVEGRLK